MIHVGKKHFIESEILRLVILALLVLYAYWPFTYGVDKGAEDALWYHTILVDALRQIDHKIFPAYIGQSDINFFGGTLMRAPYYLILGQTLHLLTFGKFSTLLIQHGTVLFSAFFAAFLTYFLLTQLNKKYRWAALFFAFFYISCPGVAGPIYLNDMYYSFMVTPYLPLLVYGLVRAHQVNDYLSSFIIAAALALICMAHPPIALWALAITFLFFGVQITLLKKGMLTFFVMLISFIILNSWQLVSIFSLNADSNYLENITKIQHAHIVMSYLKQSLPWVFLPLGWKETFGLTYLQLGYTLWATIFLSLYVALKKSPAFLIRIFLLCIGVLLLFLYPFSYAFSTFLWASLPEFIQKTTVYWPMQRFYFILAALICFMGFLSLTTFFPLLHNKTKKIIVGLFILAALWNIYQQHYFIKRFDGNRTESTWLNTDEHLYFYHHYLPKHFGLLFFEGTYDPILKNRVLDSEKNYLPNFNNEQVVANLCHTSQAHPIQQQYEYSPNHGDPQFLHFTLPPFVKEVLCIDLNPDALWVGIDIIGKNGYHTAFIPYSLKTPDVIQSIHNYKNQQTLLIPLYTHDPAGKDIIANVQLREGSHIKLSSYYLTKYNPDHLPIKIHSLFPYKATVKIASSHAYLEVFKEYFPGYQAIVNNQVVTVLESPHHLVMIPLGSGINNIQLQYKGTLLMRTAFYVCVTAWSMLIIYLVILGYRQLKYFRKF